MNKTAMQDLIDWVNKNLEEADPVYTIGLELVRHQATQLLQKEKEQIIDAFDDAQRRMLAIVYEELGIDNDFNHVEKKDAEDYFTQTYQQ